MAKITYVEFNGTEHIVEAEPACGPDLDSNNGRAQRT